MPTTPWFTPTGVGTAAAHPTFGRPVSVHPHRRGDGDRGRHGGRLRYGSPPQAWGRPHLYRCRPAPNRFTPTGVGTAFCACRWR